MPADLTAAADRFERFARDVLAPAIFPHAVPLRAEVWQCAEPVSLEEAAAAAYRDAPLGFTWGPVWSTAWFRVRGQVPSSFAGRDVVLRFSTGTEALAWRDAEPLQGLDLNRDSVLLFPRAAGGEAVDLLIEAACNHHLGQLGTHWDDPEFLRRWRTDTPARLERCELAAYDEAVWRLHWSYVFGIGLMRELPADGARAQELLGGLRRATGLVDDGNVSAAAVPAVRVITDVLGRAPEAPVLCHAVGHAHIDTAWLWPIRETKRKCIRTFATALRHIERYPDFRFACSQAQQYAWIEESHPRLFERIRERVRDGRWEAAGAMWIEPDCNLVSGESLVRQIIHGTRYWRSRFGPHAPQRVLYLPDTFGFTGALPQIMRLAGLDTFITHKLSWNQVNRFPHTNFIWRGLDGSDVLAHQMPGHDYNLLMTPRELRRGERNHENKEIAGLLSDGARPARYLQPFGFGDGGGGPTDWQILNARLAARCDGVPRVSFSRIDEFASDLHEDRAALRRAGRDFPVWNGELYLEAHRGTYTSQAWIKRANRRAEEGLRAAEILTWAGPEPPGAGEAAELRREQDAAWKLTLLNQFHDILPGSSIGWVYRDAEEQMARVHRTVELHRSRGLERLAARLDTTGAARPVLVFNPTSAAQSAVVEHDGALIHVADVPALGVRVVDAARAPGLPGAGPVRVEGMRVSNGVIEAALDERARLVGLRPAGCAHEICAPGRALGELVLYEDHPRNWDAWEIDAEYVEKATPVEFPAEGVRIESDGPLRVRVIARAAIGERSSIIREHILDAGSPRLDVRCTVDWHETHRLLRVLFPTTLRAPVATFECAFGHIERSTRRQTPQELAAFEVPGHRWVDLSDAAAGVGLGVLNDSKYGHSCHGGTIGMSLLRAPTFPDENADRGVHEFAYSLMPHRGDWRVAGVDDQAELLNAPLAAWSMRDGRQAELGPAWAPVDITVEGAARATVAALKAGEEDERLILRLVETRGRPGVAAIRWNIPVTGVAEVDLHEIPRGGSAGTFDAASRTSRVPLSPFQIVTLAAVRA